MNGLIIQFWPLISYSQKVFNSGIRMSGNGNFMMCLCIKSIDWSNASHCGKPLARVKSKVQHPSQNLFLWKRKYHFFFLLQSYTNSYAWGCFREWKFRLSSFSYLDAKYVFFMQKIIASNDQKLCHALSQNRSSSYFRVGLSIHTFQQGGSNHLADMSKFPKVKVQG